MAIWVLTAADYLDLSRAAAVSQWRQVLGRRPNPGGRQEAFTPVETLLCLAASVRVNHRRFGGSTAHLAPTPVPELARLFRRPPSSVLAKMANLDGSRRNGARHEVEIASVLAYDTAQLGQLYRTAVEAAWDAGVSRAELPDFLADPAGERTELLLVGQQELSAVDVERSVEQEVARWAAERSDVDPVQTERLLVGAVRIGQHRFATEVLTNHQHQCGFCGLRQPDRKSGGRGLLFASHIKPWRDGSGSERLDPRNGIAACPTHDVAFDTGLLTLGGSLQVTLAPALVRAVSQDPAAAAAFGSPPLAASLLLGDGGDPPSARYLRWHRARVFAAAG